MTNAIVKDTKAGIWKRKRFLLFAVILFIAVVFLVGLYVIRDHDYRNKVTYMKTAVEGATKGLLGPMGGIERRSAIVTQGEKLPVLPCIDVSCPTVEAHWYLLADKDQDKDLEKEIKEAILTKPGSSKWSVTPIVGVLGKDERPYPAPSGKEWFNISIWVTSSPDQL